MRCDEQKCAELIAAVRRSFPKPCWSPRDGFGGMYLAKPGEYTADEIRVAQASADRLGLNVVVSEGTINIEPTDVESGRKFVSTGCAIWTSP